MKRVMLVVVAVIALGACRSEAPAPTAAESTPKPIAFETMESGRIRVLIARNAGREATVATGSALERWVNDRIAPRKIAVEFIDTPEDALIQELLAGKGDIAANVLLTFERDDQVAFAKPIVTGIRELVVTGPKEPPLVSLEDVGGRSIHVRKSSDHFASLTRLNDQLKKIDRPVARIVVAATDQSDEELLKAVSDGAIPAALVDDYIFNACCAGLPGLNVNRDVAVSQDGSLSWVTRKDMPQLLAALNEFFSTHKVSF